MNDSEAKKTILSKVGVSHQQVAMSKAFMVRNFVPKALEMIDQLQESVDVRMPQEVIIHDSVDIEATLADVAGVISWRLAAAEAIWGLIHSGVFIKDTESLTVVIPSVKWTTVPTGGGSGTSSGWRFDEVCLSVPPQLRMAPSMAAHGHQPLTDPDLFLAELSIPDLDTEVEEAIREAVRCFRHELHVACLAMLGKASEGAWLDLGLTLCGVIPADKAKEAEKIRSRLVDPFVGVGKKILEVLKLYESTILSADIIKISGVRPQDLRNAVVWADTVRESRNSVHYGVEPAMSNSHEKVGTLLIAAVPHLKLLYAVKSAAAKAVG